jgi:hypothetical protein
MLFVVSPHNRGGGDAGSLVFGLMWHSPCAASEDRNGSEGNTASVTGIRPGAPIVVGAANG